MPFVDAIKRLADHPKVVLRLQAEAVVLEFERDGIQIRFTCAPSVLEWHVDVAGGAGCKVHDWFDYVGCDESSRSELEVSLVDDLTTLFHQLLQLPLRMQQDQLEAKVGDCWQGVVPVTVAG